MKNITLKIILFLMNNLPKKPVREIRDKSGKLYFKRSSYFNTKRFSIMEHEFYQDMDDFIFDKDGPLHNHPREFWSYVVEGGYEEEYIKRPSTLEPVFTTTRRAGAFDYINKKRFHKIKSLLKDNVKNNQAYCRSLCIGFNHDGEWGYFIKKDKSSYIIVDNEEFRLNKNLYKFDL
jgi:hypothetical protein